MEEPPPRTVSARSRSRRWLVLVVLIVANGLGGCTGRYSGARTLASVGTLAVLAGSATWASGEAFDRHAAVTVGFISVAAGLAAIVASGGWMASSVACTADPDCDENEQCREIPAPPGGVPYKQCMSR
jgi:hypothetical protein